MAEQFQRFYRVKDRDNVDRDFFNRRFLDLDNRLSGLEAEQDVAQTAVEELKRFGLTRIDEALAPNLARIQDATNIGFLSASVAADFAMSFAPATTSIPLLKDARQSLFTPAPFVALIRTSTPASYAIAQRLGYNKTTGVLDVQIISNVGPAGPFSDVEVWALAGSVMAGQSQIATVQSALAGAIAARDAALAANNSAVTAGTAATAAAAQADISAQQAQTAAATAANSGAGAIKVTIGDTNTAVLDNKLLVTGAITKTIGTPNGNASMTLSARLADATNTGVARLATQAEALAGTVADAIITPATLKARVDQINLAGGNNITFSTRSTNTALATGDKAGFIVLTGTFTQTFGAASALGAGWWCYVKNGGTGEITLDPNLTETIDGLASYIMYPGEVRLIQCDGTQFRTIVIQSFAQFFRGPGTLVFTRPPGYSHFDVHMIGGAGGGEGGGSRGTNFSNLFGGTGGCGGALMERRIAFTDMGATETIVLGDGGVGGAGRAYQQSVSYGLPGGDAGDSRFGNFIWLQGAKGGGRSGNYGAAPIRNYPTGNNGVTGPPIASATADNSIVIPVLGGGGPGFGTQADEGIFYSYAGGRSIAGGYGGGAGGGYWVNNGTQQASSELRAGAAGGSRLDASNPTSVSGGGAAGGAAGWQTNGANGANGALPSTNALAGTGGGGGGAGTAKGGNGGAGSFGSGGGGGGAGFSGGGGTGGKGGAAAALVIGIL